MPKRMSCAVGCTSTDSISPFITTDHEYLQADAGDLSAISCLFSEPTRLPAPKLRFEGQEAKLLFRLTAGSPSSQLTAACALSLWHVWRRYGAARPAAYACITHLPTLRSLAALQMKSMLLSSTLALPLARLDMLERMHRKPSFLRYKPLAVSRL